jgi:hypothetical protein
MTRTLKALLCFAVLTIAAALAGTPTQLTPGAGSKAEVRQTS